MTKETGESSAGIHQCLVGANMRMLRWLLVE